MNRRLPKKSSTLDTHSAGFFCYCLYLYNSYISDVCMFYIIKNDQENTSYLHKHVSCIHNSRYITKQNADIHLQKESYSFLT